MNVTLAQGSNYGKRLDFQFQISLKIVNIIKLVAAFTICIYKNGWFGIPL